MKNKDTKNISSLIEKITPLNNKYRDLINASAKGADVLAVMWDVGSYLQEFVKSYNIKPHNLYWQIYGKAEGLKNSYITRDFLSYCLRVKKYFSIKTEIKVNYFNLASYSLFREAFPLLENSKFKLSESESAKLINLLNSKLHPHEIKKKIVEIKKARIGIENTRNQKLSEMVPFTNSFVDFYNHIYSLIKMGKIEEIKKLRQDTSVRYLNNLSQLISALMQEGLFVPLIKPNESLSNQWQDFINNLNTLFSNNVETRNRFRRLVAPKKIMKLSDMVLALTDDKHLGSYKKRNNLA